ncbi:hypothetical protein BLA39750_01106 [Burkholderia lata]|uniref:Uncharacterized protein n=1 Tax=Burkholderia lata (strain ATCC 17760 / DSM 23089 / LMG 22485 / NCIMB 9086 / R18194 / 383) TaxID=482957 RepID=A0A6P2VHF8_BURL3|nr:hypothetical protein [Burkholderia lata]VWC79749.1 hypothetical protein BLA39750_01106 [Burkholderia lata]
MSIREERRYRALSRYSHVIDDVRLGRLAHERATDIARMSPSSLEAAIRTGLAVLLSHADSECGYLGLYVPERDAIIVCAVTLDERGYEDGVPVIAELLELDEFERKGGAVEIEVRRRIVGRQLNPVELRDWEKRHLGESYSWPRPRVFIYFERDGRVRTHFARRPPICRDWIDTYGLENMLGHPGAWDWFRGVLGNAQITPESVISLRVADGVKMRLDIAAAPKPCPACKYAHGQVSPIAADNMSITDVDLATNSAPSRLLGRLAGVLLRHRPKR